MIRYATQMLIVTRFWTIKLLYFNPFEPEFTIVISSTTSRDCCRNSRLVVDEDDLKWVKN